MSAPIAYPDSLPCPSSAVLQRAERRGLSTLPGARQSRVEWTDKVSTQSLTFPLRDAAMVQAWLDWYRDALGDGAAWFSASWPQPEGGVGVRRFVGVPSYPEYLSKSKGWRVTATVQVRGRGVQPLDQRDPYRSSVILQLLGDNANPAYDSSPLALTLGGSATRNTAQFKYGSGAIDTSTGPVTISDGNYHARLMLDNEWTLRFWCMPTALPVGSNNRLLYFSQIIFAMNADGSIAANMSTDGGTYGVGAPAGTAVLDEFQFYALTRTNEGSESVFQLYVGSELVDTSLTFLSGAIQESFGSLDLIAGYDTPNHTIFQDLELTLVNRYRGMTTITPPDHLRDF